MQNYGFNPGLHYFGYKIACISLLYIIYDVICNYQIANHIPIHPFRKFSVAFYFFSLLVAEQSV